MKRLLCHFAQRTPTPHGLLSRHVANCQKCLKFHNQVSSLESRLVTSVGEPDADLCDQIMSRISSKTPEVSAPSKRPLLTSPFALTTAASLILGLISILAVTHFKQPEQMAEVTEEQTETHTSPAAETTRKMNLAYTLEQQALLQRDALKLGAHLRENLIIFQRSEQ